MPLDPAKIKSLREKRKLTAAAAATAAGMDRPNWSRLENGRNSDPSLSTCEAVAAALGVPLAAIATRPA